jgi:hypothetical protein
MIVELDIFDMNGASVTPDTLVFNSTSIPVPNVGEDVVIALQKWTVRERQFGYSHHKIKVILSCEGPKELPPSESQHWLIPKTDDAD